MFFFYVKHRDFLEPERTVVTNMMLDPATVVTSLRLGATTPWKYGFNGGIDWLGLAMKPIVEHFFRDEGENWNSALLDNVPMAQVFGKGHNNWSDSLTVHAAKRTDREVALPTNLSDLEDRMAHWMAIRDAGLTDMDYEDFVRTYGGETRQEETSPELHRPELLRYIRQFSYPTNVRVSGLFVVFTNLCFIRIIVLLHLLIIPSLYLKVEL